jgi:iron complex transport system substrate-binding protein
VHESWENEAVTLDDTVTDVGDFEQPDLEQILATEPDFIIATGNLDSQTALVDQFESAGIPTAYFEVSNFDDYLHMLSVCTDITGRKDFYKTNGTDVEDQITALKGRITGEEPTVLVIRTSARAGVKAKDSKGTVLGEVLADCGTRNIADSDSGLLDDLSLEAIIRDDPDYIFVTSMGNDTEAAEKALQDALTGQSAWQSLSAVKNDRYYVMDKNLFNSKPNKRWAEAYKQVIDILYPEQ